MSLKKMVDTISMKQNLPHGTKSGHWSAVPHCCSLCGPARNDAAVFAVSAPEQHRTYAAGTTAAASCIRG